MPAVPRLFRICNTMKNTKEKTHMGDVQNQFTAYLLQAAKNTVINYTDKKKRMDTYIRLINPEQIEVAGDRKSQTFEIDGMEVYPVMDSNIPDWQQCLGDECLLKLFIRLTRREREIVLKRIFLKQSFAQIGGSYKLTGNQARHVYYYAISKLRRYSDGI